MVVGVGINSVRKDQSIKGFKALLRPHGMYSTDYVSRGGDVYSWALGKYNAKEIRALARSILKDRKKRGV